uniref:Uncharacterized protein n=1 Tax=Oryza meridionalis TaxID=40149 RepID=A0A0E0DAH4_9ORYZ
MAGAASAGRGWIWHGTAASAVLAGGRRGGSTSTAERWRARRRWIRHSTIAGVATRDDYGLEARRLYLHR